MVHVTLKASAAMFSSRIPKVNHVTHFKKKIGPI